MTDFDAPPGTTEKVGDTTAVAKARQYLPDAATYVKDYCAVWIHGTCYFFRRSAKNEWVYEK